MMCPLLHCMTLLLLSPRGRYVKTMAQFMLARAEWLATPNMLFPWGSDFEFQNATAMYPNMDRVLEYINAHSDELGFTAEYSTLSGYFDALHAYASNRSYDFATRQRGDFLPYTDPAPPVGQHWWSGEFTSWPILKKRTRPHSGDCTYVGIEKPAAVCLTLRTCIQRSRKGRGNASQC
jgi:hypothetical protein